MIEIFRIQTRLRGSVATLVIALGLALPAASAEAPQRIVSLDLCSDWMLLTYARREQLRALSPYLYQFDNDWVEPGLAVHDGSLEQVLALKPDLVISGEFNALLLRNRLQQLGVNVQVLPNPRRLGDIGDYILRLRQLLGAPSLTAELDAVPQELDLQRPRRGNRLLLLGANGIGAGRDTLEHDIISAAGWDNYLNDSGFIALDLESLIADPPYAIFISAARANSLALRFIQHPALQQRIINTRWDSQQNWRWTCPGPWSYRLIEELNTWGDH